MHELGIMYHIVEQVLSVTQENNLSKVEAIVLQVGELSSVVPRYLEKCYPAAIDKTILKDTKLEIEIMPANGMCPACHKVYPLLINNNICPYCHDDKPELISGKEFYLKEIRAY